MSMHAVTHILFSTKDIVFKDKIDAKDILSRLKPGQLIEAKVLQGGGPGRKAVLQLFGRKIQVDTHSILNPGEKILLKVGRSGTETLLKLVPPQQAMQSVQSNTLQFSANMPKSALFGSLIDLMPALDGLESGLGEISNYSGKLKELLSNIALKSEKPDMTFLARLIQDGGTGLERKLKNLLLSKAPVSRETVREIADQDLKGISLKLVSLLEGGKHGPDRIIRMFAEHLEQQHVFTQTVLDATGRLFLPFPILSAEEWRFGQLLIHLNQEGKTGKTGEASLTRLSLLLDLSRLGPLAADFLVYGQSVNGAFVTADEDVKALIIKEIPQLKTRIQTHGFHVDHIDCRLSPRADLSQMSLVDQALKADGLLNIVL